MARFWITPTAQNHIRNALSNTRDKWGHNQAVKYRQKLEQGLQHIADNHHTFNSPHRNELAKDTTFSIHLIEHHYVAFQKHDKNIIIIAGIFHESMDIKTRLTELHSMTRHEIDALKREIMRNQARPKNQTARAR
jgi:plasmid stabilization system protein ParE